MHYLVDPNALTVVVSNEVIEINVARPMLLIITVVLMSAHPFADIHATVYLEVPDCLVLAVYHIVLLCIV